LKVMADRNRPLRGRAVLLTRPAGRGAGLAAQLREWGAVVRRRPTIELEALRSGETDASLARLADYDWVVFTSANGVTFFHRLLDESGRAWPSPGPRLACIGGATAQVLMEHIATPDLVAAESRAEGLAERLTGKLQQNDRVLWVRPEEAREVLQERLAAAGARVDAVAFYRNLPARGLSEVVREIVDGKYDAIVFTAPSTLARMLDAAGESERRLRESLRRTALVAIGPVTASALEERGLAASTVAAEPSDAGLANAVLRAVAT
jgi:uroporphyrinogen III methyltransferase/synthase